MEEFAENERNVRPEPFNTSRIVDGSEGRGSALFSFPVAQSDHGEETMMRYSLFPSHVKEPNAKGGISRTESGFQFLPPNPKLWRKYFSEWRMTEGNDVRKGCEDVLVTPLWAKRKELRRKQGA